MVFPQIKFNDNEKIKLLNKETMKPTNSKQRIALRISSAKKEYFFILKATVRLLNMLMIIVIRSFLFYKLENNLTHI